MADLGLPRPIVYFPLGQNYPVDQADQRQPYVNYLPITRYSPVTSVRGPLTRVYSPHAGTPASAIAECLLQEGDRRQRGQDLGIPWHSRDRACMNHLNWTEKKGRNSEDYF